MAPKIWPTLSHFQKVDISVYFWRKNLDETSRSPISYCTRVPRLNISKGLRFLASFPLFPGQLLSQQSTIFQFPFRAVCHPLMRRQSYYKYITVVIILAVTIEFPRFFEMRLNNDWTQYWTTDLMEDPNYVRFSSYWNEIMVTGLAPLVILCYMNLRIFLKIKVRFWVHYRVHENYASAFT